MIFKELYRFFFIIKIISIYRLYEFIPKKNFFYIIFYIIDNIFFYYKNFSKYVIAKRLRLALQELGPVWIKFGQMLSTRYDLLSSDIINELVMLQDKVKPFSSDIAKTCIISSINKPFEKWCNNFQEKPIASASIAQVHAARFLNGKEIVIKIVRPNILEIIKIDINVIYKLIYFISYFSPLFRKIKIKRIIIEYEKIIMNEVNLLNEMVNAIQLKRNFKNSNLLYIPEVYPDYCSKTVMVMERVYGFSINDLKKLREYSFNMKVLAEKGVKIFFKQVFKDGFFHADMHPGNILVYQNTRGNPKYISIDYGIVGYLSNNDKRYIAENFIAFFNRDYNKIAKLHLESGWIPDDVRIEEFEQSIRNLCEPIFNQPLYKISFGKLFVNLLSTVQQFNIEIQPQLFLLQKTLLYIEGIGQRLYPKLDLWKTVKPLLENWIKKQFSIINIIKNIKNKIPFYLEKLPEVPELLLNNLEKQRKIEEKIQELSSILNFKYIKKMKFQFCLTIGTILVLIGITFLLNNFFIKSISIVFFILGIFCYIIGWILIY